MHQFAYPCKLEGVEVTEAHGGTLTVQSTLGEGSLFTVWLPDAGGGAANSTATPR